MNIGMPSISQQRFGLPSHGVQPNSRQAEPEETPAIPIQVHYSHCSVSGPSGVSPSTVLPTHPDQEAVTAEVCEAMNPGADEISDAATPSPEAHQEARQQYITHESVPCQQVDQMPNQQVYQLNQHDQQFNQGQQQNQLPNQQTVYPPIRTLLPTPPPPLMSLLLKPSQKIPLQQPVAIPVEGQFPVGIPVIQRPFQPLPGRCSPLHPQVPVGPQETPSSTINLPQHSSGLVESYESTQIEPSNEQAEKPDIVGSGNHPDPPLDSAEPDDFEALLNQEVSSNCSGHQAVMNPPQVKLTSALSTNSDGPNGIDVPRLSTSRGNLGPKEIDCDQKLFASEIPSHSQNFSPAQKISMEWKARNTPSDPMVASQSIGEAKYQREASAQGLSDHTPLLPTPQPLLPLPVDFNQRASTNPKYIELRKHIENASHQGSTVMEKNKSNFVIRSFGFTGEKSSEYKRASLPPRFRARLDSQHQGKTFQSKDGLDHFAPVSSAVQAMSVDKVDGLNKRKAVDQDGMIDKTKMRQGKDLTEKRMANKEEDERVVTEEWQTQVRNLYHCFSFIVLVH